MDMEPIKILSDRLGGSFGSCKIAWKGRHWVYKKMKPQYEVAAYQIFEALRPFKRGSWYVPETVLVDEEHSAQLFVDEAAPAMRVADQARRWAPTMLDEVTRYEIDAFDFLIGNGDRHQFNYMFDMAKQAVLIDHGISFEHRCTWQFTLGYYYDCDYEKYLPGDYRVDYWQPAYAKIREVFPVEFQHDLERRFELLVEKSIKEIRGR